MHLNDLLYGSPKSIVNNACFDFHIKRHIKVNGLHIQTFCNEKDSYIDAIQCINTFKWFFLIPKQGK